MSDLRTSLSSMPSVFLAHGAPDLLLSDIPARSFLQRLGPALTQPKAIVIISAHWAMPELNVTGAHRLEAAHDFRGWAPELYEMSYPAQGSASVVEQLVGSLGDAGYPVSVNNRRGLDHGAWVPLHLMYPRANVPVVQLSLLRGATSVEHFQVGEALCGLRREGILVVGSGATVHNLRLLKPEGTPPDAWARSFDAWLFDNLQRRDLARLFDFPSQAPDGGMAHPTPEHLMPLFVAMGAGWSEEQVHRIHHSYSYGNLGMASFAFAQA